MASSSHVRRVRDVRDVLCSIMIKYRYLVGFRDRDPMPPGLGTFWEYGHGYVGSCIRSNN